MSDDREESKGRGRDTSPLQLRQLSDHELTTIREIELRLQEVQDICATRTDSDPLHYCQRTQRRDPRVLLLDGGRGSGKTSLLLTMTAWWHGEKRRETAHKKLNSDRVDRIQKIPGLGGPGTTPDIPGNVRVLRIIDFDPLPPEMPLMAGIVQAWKSVAEHYDQLSGGEHKDGLLIDVWHRLFQISALGWTPIASGKGLIEQILDREEQVQDWYGVSEMWQSFIEAVIARGIELKSCGAEAANPVFAIMIDDVDLQVGRIRELLPALRMLYHPRVFFIVAADQSHMRSMLELDFLGQQRRLGRQPKSGDSASDAKFDRWPNTLATAAFTKVFPPTNIWRLNGLTLRDLLNFPLDRPETRFRVTLNKWATASSTGLGDYLYKYTGDPLRTGAVSSGVGEAQGNELDLPTLMSYRDAHQLSELVESRGISRNTALKVVSQMIGGDESSNLVKVMPSADPDGLDGRLEYLPTGELGALFPKVFGVKIQKEREIVLSGRPKFAFRDGLSRELIWRTDEQPKIWPHLLAASLRDDGFNLLASGLEWNVYLALVWTRVPMPESGEEGLDLAFWWRIHELPSPLKFITWAREWEQFVQRLSNNASSQIERVAYGWVYHQLRWMSSDPVSLVKRVLDPLDDNFNRADSWERLLAEEPATDVVRWKTVTLPLLARPELGLPPEVQKRLLKPVKQPYYAQLRYQRARLITDAIVAAGYPNNNTVENPEDPKRVAKLTEMFDRGYEEAYRETSWWMQTMTKASTHAHKASRKKSDAAGRSAQ